MELMGVSVGNPQGSEQWRQLSVGMQVAGSEGHGALAVAYEPAGRGSDGSQPVGDILRIADRGGEQEQFGL